MKIGFIAAALVSVLSAPAFAAETTGSFDVSTSVSGSCVVVSASALAFGTYDSVTTHASRNLETTSQISVRCTAGSTNVSVGLSEGLHSRSGSSCASPLRQLAGSDGVSFLEYGVLDSVNNFKPWGCDTGADLGSDRKIASFTSSIEPVVLGTRGQIFGGQNAGAGSYTDTVNVNVTF